TLSKSEARRSSPKGDVMNGGSGKFFNFYPILDFVLFVAPPASGGRHKKEKVSAIFRGRNPTLSILRSARSADLRIDKVEPYEEFQLERLVYPTVGGLCDLSSTLNPCAITGPAIVGAAAIAGVDTSGPSRDADADAGAGPGSGRSGKAVV